MKSEIPDFRLYCNKVRIDISLENGFVFLCFQAVGEDQTVNRRGESISLSIQFQPCHGLVNGTPYTDHSYYT